MPSQLTVASYAHCQSVHPFALPSNDGFGRDAAEAPNATAAKASAHAPLMRPNGPLDFSGGGGGGYTKFLLGLATPLGNPPLSWARLHSAFDAFARSGFDRSETSVDFPVTTSEKSDFSAFRSGLGLAPNTPFRKSS